MIHFDFKVSDDDAENIFSILRQQINRNNRKMLSDIDEFDRAYYRQDNDYIEGLIKKMTNTLVKE